MRWQTLLVLSVLFILFGQSAFVAKADLNPANLFTEGDGLYICQGDNAENCPFISSDIDEDLSGSVRALIFRGGLDLTLYSNNRNRDDVVTIKIVNNTNGAVSCTYDTYIGGLVNPEYRWSLAVWVQEHGSGEGYQGDHILDCSNALEAYQSGGKTAYVLDLRDLYYLCTSGYPHNGTCGGIKWDAVSSGYSIDATMIGSSSELCGNNGVIDQGEDCDGTNLNGQTCVSRGFNGGVLVCSNRCRFDTSGCYNEPPETPIDLSALFSQGNGLYACTEAVAASCQKISEGSSLSLLGNNNDKFDYIAFNTPISAHFFEEINYSKPSIKITYAGSSAPDCAYQLYTKTDPATGMPVWERQDNNVFLPCSQDRRGWAPDALTSYTLDGGTAYLISLDSLCVLDDRETEPGDLGTSCALSWQDRISSLKEGREPVCGNGTVERGEECGEPGLSCEEGYECENCRCPRFVPLGLAEKIQNLYFWVVSLAGLVALGLIIFGGVMYAASGGNPSRISEAKSWITHALAGLGMLLAAYLILGFINPDLTKLQDIFLRVNVNPQAPGLELGEGGGGALVGEDCSGFYVSSSPGDRQMLVKQGNFGDPECEYADSILSDGGATFKNAVYLALQYKAERVEGIIDGVDYVDQRAVDILYNDVIPEESGFYPNAVLLRSDNPNVPQPTGAWGMLQMGASEAHGRPDPSQYDIGDVEWSRQVDNAILRLSITDRCRVYWSTWPGWSEDPKKSRPIYRGCPSETNPQIPI